LLKESLFVELEDQRDLPCVLAGDGLDEAERRRIGVAGRVDRELDVVLGS